MATEVEEVFAYLHCNACYQDYARSALRRLEEASGTPWYCAWQV